jgi:hypothetical protein
LREFVVWASVGVASILVFMSALALWADDQGLDTNRWTDTSTELLGNEAIRHEVARYGVRQVFERTRLKQILTRLEHEKHGEELVAQLRSEAVAELEQFLETPLGRELWRAANRTAHRQLMQIILHESPRPVVLDLGTIAASLSRQNGVIGQLASALPPDTARLVVLPENRVREAQTAARVIVPLTSLLVIVAVALAVVALVLARTRRRLVLAALGLGAILAGVGVLLVREFGGQYVVDGLVRSDSARPAAEATWRIGTTLMPDTAIPVIAIGGMLVLVALAWSLVRR